MTRYNFELESFIRLRVWRGKALKRKSIACLRPHPHCAGGIWKRSFIATVKHTVRSIPIRHENEAFRKGFSNRRNLKTKLKFYESMIGFDEVLTLETSVFESLYGGQFTWSTHSIKPNYLVNKYSPSMQYHSFFRNLPLWSLVQWLGLQSSPTRHENGAFRKRSSNPRNLRTELVGNNDLTIILRCDRWLSRFKIPPKLCGRKRFRLRVKPLFTLV